MLDASACEQLSQRTVLHVSECVVGHDPLRGDPVLLEPAKGSFHEGGHGCRFLVVVQLDIGQTAVVIDDRVGEVGADTCLGSHPVARALRAIAGHRVSWALKAPVAGHVHVQ
jgi:hypothetical protein